MQRRAHNTSQTNSLEQIHNFTANVAGKPLKALTTSHKERNQDEACLVEHKASNQTVEKPYKNRCISFV